MWKRLLVALLATTSIAVAEDLERAVDGYLAAAEPDALDPWTISGAFGLTITDGNSDTVTLTAGVEAERMWGELWTLTLKEASIYSEDSNVQSANEHIFTERLDYKLNDKSSVFQDLWLEYDDEENLKLRLQFTLGYKRQLVKKSNFELHGEVGGGVLYEDFRIRSDTEGIAQLGIRFKWQITKTLEMTHVTVFYPSLSEGGEFRFVSETVLTMPVSDRLDMRFAFIDKYDSDPVAGNEKNDLLVTLSLVVHFTKKKE